MDEIERRLKVDADDGIPLLLSHSHHQAILGDSRVVDKNIDPSEIGEDLLHDNMSLLEISRIGSVSFDLMAESLQFLDCLFSRLVDHEVGKCHIGSFGGEFKGDRLSDSSRRARDEGDFSFQ